MFKRHPSRFSLRSAPLAAAFAALLALTLPTALAQTPASASTHTQPPAAATPAAAPDYVPTLTFDVASVRESAGVQNSGMRVGVVSPPHTSKFMATNFPVKGLIQSAYGFGTPIVGGPDWLNQVYFTIDAKSDHSVDDQLAKLTDDQSKAEKQHMLQALLADRFHLKFHTEIRDSSVYALTIAKGGSKMRETKVDPDDPSQPSLANKGVDVQAHGGAQGLEFDVRSASMRAVAGMLISQIESPVLDRTGLTGYYDFTLQFGRDWSSTNPDSWPSIFTAVQEQLGLKLDSTRASVEVLVIDHIERPSDN